MKSSSNTINSFLRIFFGLFLLAWGTAFIAGCDECDDCLIITEDNTPPAVPCGLYSVTGNGHVDLFWAPNYEDDFDFYAVYRSTEDIVGPYSEIGTTTDNSYRDNNVNNGDTYFYAITSVDDILNESDLSYEDIFDTPRWDGFGARVYDYNISPGSAGFDLSQGRVVDGDDADSDIWFDYSTIVDPFGNDVESFFINIADYDTDIQDFGYTDSIIDVDWSPADGWSEVGWYEIILGHSYIIWTADNNFATIRVTGIDAQPGGYVRFNWAYQDDTGNRELKRVPKIVPPRNPGYGDKTFAGNSGN
jgi:hypothetical protein